MTEAFTAQEELEHEMIASGVTRYKENIARSKAGRNPKTGKRNPALESNTSYGHSIMKEHIPLMARQIVRDIEKWNGRAGRKPVAYKYLSKLDPVTCAFVASKVILDNLSGTTALTAMVSRIGGKLEDQTRIDIFKLQDSKYYRATTRYLKEKAHADTYQKKRKGYIHAAKRREDIIKPWVEWSTFDKIHIGNALLEAFIRVTSDYDENDERIIGSGIVEKVTVYNKKKTKYYIQGTHKAFDWIDANMEVCQFFMPEFMPCVAPPLDWVSPTDGGYHTRKLQERKPLVKMQQRKYLRRMEAKGVDNCIQFYRAVNTLQAIPWEINETVYGTMMNEFRSPYGVDMPPRARTPEPIKPDFFMEQGNRPTAEWVKERRAAAKLWTTEQKQEYVKWTYASQKHKREENERVHEILEIQRTMKVAKRFIFEDALYFVWTADFRSRLYSTGTALSPQGTDKSKALLRFKRGVPLGTDGFEHLCIHACGVYGFDKGTLNDRIQWCLDHKHEIMATAKNPDETQDFWKQADKPYSFLAVCDELGQCIQLSTSMREKFISHIPCAQDGSCNGIQHYSAMLRDPLGAHAVNLVDSERPADIYNQCRDKVIEFIHYSIKHNVSWTGHEWSPMRYFDEDIAQGWLDFGIERDCTKKPTMVIPYGGTKIGCRDDCREYLEKFTKKRKAMDVDYRNPFVELSTYDDAGTKTDPEVAAITWLHHLVWHALDEVVVAARVAMKFLRQVTNAVTRSDKKGKAMQWTTPTGFIVYQDIKLTTMYRVNSHLEGRIQLTLHKDIDVIDTRRMQTSIAPNFVHSLDSSHLQKTVCLANDMGIEDFACIHDSFGTHAGNTTMLHACIRHTFIEIHRENVLMNFWNEQYKRDPKLLKHLPALSDIKQGDFDLSHIKKSTHFFR
jgi:DNA-directed RNA polymerase